MKCDYCHKRIWFWQESENNMHRYFCSSYNDLHKTAKGIGMSDKDLSDWLSRQGV